MPKPTDSPPSGCPHSFSFRPRGHVHVFWSNRPDHSSMQPGRETKKKSRHGSALQLTLDRKSYWNGSVLKSIHWRIKPGLPAIVTVTFHNAYRGYWITWTV